MDKKAEREEEIKQLEQWIKTNPDSRELKRAIAVKLSLQGWTYRAITPILNVSSSFISKWKTRFKQEGISGLKLSYKGAKSYLNSQEKQAVITWLQQQKFWDLSELECHLIDKYDLVFKSPTSYYNLLKEAKITWQKAQGKNSRQDPEKVKKKNQEIKKILLEELPNILKGETVVYAMDEVHLLEGDLISHLWDDSKKRLELLMDNPKNRQTYYGALDLFNPELIIQDYARGNSDYTVEFLKKLLNQNRGKKIIIFWDGAAYHKGEKMRNFLFEVNGDLEPQQWRITCHLFAPYSPEENPIEAIWLSLKNLLRRCYRFCKNFRIMKKIFQLLVELKLFNFPHLENYDAFSCLI